jgi:predicted DNA-binding transcriptional regulator AlpA
MQRNSILLQDLSLDQLTELMRKVVKTETDDLKKHYQPTQPKEFLTRSEVASLLSVDLSTIHNYCKRKILQPKGIGGRVYFLRSEVEASIKPLND